MACQVDRNRRSPQSRRAEGVQEMTQEIPTQARHIAAERERLHTLVASTVALAWGEEEPLAEILHEAAQDAALDALLQALQATMREAQE